MEYRSLLIILLFIACSIKEKKLSKSYKQVQQYLEQTRIADPRVIYFYSGKPRMPMPNVYCFDKNGNEVNSPPQCFNFIKDYIGLLNDSIMPLKKNGRSVNDFLNSVPIIDSYDQPVKIENLTGYEYYLFIDFLAMPVPSFQETLLRAKQMVVVSKKKIKLFLVHAISERNLKLFSKKDLIQNDSGEQ